MCRFEETPTESEPEDQYFLNGYGSTPLSFYLTFNLQTLCDDGIPLNAIVYKTADMAFGGRRVAEIFCKFLASPTKDRFGLEHI
jgi:hypothetical protein